jgi:hypothetical protein
VREAQRADERTFAYFARFRAALIQRFGADPLLTKLKWSEQEGEALVHKAPDAPAQHVIWQAGNWISTDGRELKPWAPGADPATARFRLSQVSEAMLRERFKAYRAQPAKAADHLGDVTVGYFGKPFDRLLAEVTVVGMSGSFGMSAIAFDLKTGQSLDVNAAVADARAKREAAQRKDAAEAKAASQRNLRHEIPAVLAQFRREVGPARLMAVWVTRSSVTFIQADRAVYDYDRRGTITRRKSPYDQSWLCTDGFDDGEIDWANLTPLIDKAILAANLDDEDRDHAVINVERPHPAKCEPTKIEIQFTNYKTPWPWVAFDAKGRLTRVR